MLGLRQLVESMSLVVLAMPTGLAIGLMVLRTAAGLERMGAVEAGLRLGGVAVSGALGGE